MSTPTPETDAFLGTLERHEGRATWSIKDIEALVERTRSLERELDEARADEAHRLILFSQRMLPVVMAERDQLRKVADELAAKLKRRGESEFSSNALADYNQLPHVIERNKTV